MARRDEGSVLLVAAATMAALAVAAALLGTVAVAGTLRSRAQAAADAAALAAAERLAEMVWGTDAAVWDCAGVPAAPLRATAERVARTNGAMVEALRREACDVVVAVRVDGRGRARESPMGRAIAAAAHGLHASARARVSPGLRPGSGPAVPLSVPAAPLGRGTLLQALVAEADRIDRLALPYVWGGGHQSSPAPPNGPFDCSGAVSRVLQAVGYPLPTLVSRQFMGIGRPGPGRVTIWAYDGHVFMTIDGRGWGTGSPPRGGAGWLPYNRPYHSRFVARHLPEFEDDTVHDLSGLDLGTVLVGGPGAPPRVSLVALGG